MSLTLSLAIFLTAAFILLSYWLARKQARADFDARRNEMQTSIDETRERERQANGKAGEFENRCDKIAEELKTALEEKGRFESQAARVAEVRATVAERDNQISSLNNRVLNLELEKTEALKDSEAAKNLAVQMIQKEREAQAEVLKAKDEQIQKLNEFITKAREVLSTEFKALSTDVLSAASTELVKTADDLAAKHGTQTAADLELRQQNIAAMLKPVEDTMKRLDKRVEDTNLARVNAEALLNEQVNRLAGASESLTSALRKPVVRGSWGEMVLEDALENAGLQPEIDFILQHTTDAEDGRKRTDAIITMPKGRKLIIDSKNLMESYIALANATDDADRAVLAENHSKSLRAHIKALWAKEYWKRYEGLDCVFLFIPHDGMYYSALRDEAELLREATEKRVFICNPMTLIPLLKSIRYVLDQDRSNKNAEEIRNVGTDLYTEITRFAEHLATIGERLKSTVKAYNDAIPGLDRYIVSRSRKLKQLGLGRGAEAELPEEVDLEPRSFSSQELKGLDIAASEDQDAPPVEAASAH
jgi:DNA recombination protein RmuC